MKVTGLLLSAFLVLSVVSCAPKQSAKSTVAAESAPVASPEAATVPKVEELRAFKAEAAAPEENLPKGRMPDTTMTPGKASYRTLDQICAKGSSTKDERNVSDAEKNAVYQEYGVAKCEGWCSGEQGCEVDHLISLEIGGANTEDNLWPQPYDGDWSAHDKDRLENKLHQLVCNKTITLKEAQTAISTDWVAAYKKYVGQLKPFKATKRCP